MGFEFFGVPFDFFADSVCDVTEVVGFGEPSGVFEVAGGGGAGFAGVYPFGVVANGFGDELFGGLEVFEVVFGEEEVFTVVG